VFFVACSAFLSCVPVAVLSIVDSAVVGAPSSPVLLFGVVFYVGGRTWLPRRHLGSVGGATQISQGTNRVKTNQFTINQERAPHSTICMLFRMNNAKSCETKHLCSIRSSVQFWRM